MRHEHSNTLYFYILDTNVARTRLLKFKTYILKIYIIFKQGNSKQMSLFIYMLKKSYKISFMYFALKFYYFCHMCQLGYVTSV